jgi:ubiquinone/menaquinone biosynthesis C-methylase UbiE
VPDNSVDIVVSTMVLCSVRSVEGALKEVHRVLAPVCCSINVSSVFFDRVNVKHPPIK